MKVPDGRQEVTQILLMLESLVWLMQPRQFEHKKKVFYELLKRGKNDSEVFFVIVFEFLNWRHSSTLGSDVRRIPLRGGVTV